MSLTPTQESNLVSHIQGVVDTAGYGSGAAVHVTQAVHDGTVAAAVVGEQSAISGTNKAVTRDNIRLLAEAERKALSYAVGGVPTLDNPVITNNVPMAIPALAVVNTPDTSTGTGIRYLAINFDGHLPTGAGLTSGPTGNAVAVACPVLKTAMPEIYVGLQGVNNGVSSAYQYFGLENVYGEGVINTAKGSAVVVSNVFWDSIGSGNVFNPVALGIGLNGFVNIGHDHTLILELSTSIPELPQQLCLRLNIHGVVENIAAQWNAPNMPSFPSPTVYRNIKQPFVAAEIGDFQALNLGQAPHRLHFNFLQSNGNTFAHIAMYVPNDDAENPSYSEIVLGSDGRATLRSSASDYLDFNGGQANLYATGTINLVATNGTIDLSSQHAPFIRRSRGVYEYDYVTGSLATETATYRAVSIIPDTGSQYTAWRWTSWARMIANPQHLGDYTTCTSTYGFEDNSNGMTGLGLALDNTWSSGSMQRSFTLRRPLVLQNNAAGRAKMLLSLESDDVNTTDYGSPSIWVTRFSPNTSGATSNGPDMYSLYASSANTDTTAVLALGAMLFNDSSDFVSSTVFPKLLLSSDKSAYGFTVAALSASFSQQVAARFTSGLNVSGYLLIQGATISSGPQAVALNVNHTDMPSAFVMHGADTSGFAGNASDTSHHVMARAGVYANTTNPLRWNRLGPILGNPGVGYGYGIYATTGRTTGTTDLPSALFGAADIWLLPTNTIATGSYSVRIGPAATPLEFVLAPTNLLATQGTHQHILFANSYTSSQKLWIGTGTYTASNSSYALDELHSIRIDANGSFWLPKQASGSAMLGFGTAASGLSGTNGAVIMVSDILQGYSTNIQYTTRFVAGDATTPSVSGGFSPTISGLHVYGYNTTVDLTLGSLANLQANSVDAISTLTFGLDSIPTMLLHPSHLTPCMGVDLDLGTASRKWRNLYVGHIEASSVNDASRVITGEAQMPYTGVSNPLPGVYSVDLDTTLGSIHQSGRLVENRGLVALHPRVPTTATMIKENISNPGITGNGSTSSIAWCWRHNRYYRVVSFSGVGAWTKIQMSYDAITWEDADTVTAYRIAPIIASSDGYPVVVYRTNDENPKYQAKVSRVVGTWVLSNFSMYAYAQSGSPCLAGFVAHEYFQGTGYIGIYWYQGTSGWRGLGVTLTDTVFTLTDINLSTFATPDTSDTMQVVCNADQSTFAVVRNTGGANPWIINQLDPSLPNMLATIATPISGVQSTTTTLAVAVVDAYHLCVVEIFNPGSGAVGAGCISSHLYTPGGSNPTVADTSWPFDNPNGDDVTGVTTIAYTKRTTADELMVVLHSERGSSGNYVDTITTHRMRCLGSHATVTTLVAYPVAWVQPWLIYDVNSETKPRLSCDSVNSRFTYNRLADKIIGVPVRFRSAVNSDEASGTICIE